MQDTLDLKVQLKKEPLKVWFILSKAISITEFVGEHKGAFFCPFHDDINKPSAILKLQDKDEIHRLQCFSCGSQFTSYHYVTKILNVDPINYIFSNIPDVLIRALYNGSETLSNQISQEKIAHINFLWQESKQDLTNFIDLLYKVNTTC